MVVKDLFGNEYKLRLPTKKKKNSSKLHKRAIDCLRNIYPNLIIVEEVPIKVEPGLTLFLDIYIPMLNLVIEAHGQQHFSFNKHYHKYPHRFGRAQLNDSLKREWCEINGFRLVELPYNESTEVWESRIRKTIRCDS